MVEGKGITIKASGGLRARCLLLLSTMELVDSIKEAWGWIPVEPEKVIDNDGFGNVIFRDGVGAF